MKSPAVVPLAWSPLLCLAAGLVHLVSFACVLGEGVPTWVRYVVASLCVISGAYNCRVALGLRTAALRPHAEGAQLIAAGRARPGRVLASSIDMGALVVLHWQEEGAGQVLRYALLRDAFSPAEWRILKVWLRWSIMKQPA